MTLEPIVNETSQIDTELIDFQPSEKTNKNGTGTDTDMVEEPTYASSLPSTGYNSNYKIGEVLSESNWELLLSTKQDDILRIIICDLVDGTNGGVKEEVVMKKTTNFRECIVDKTIDLSDVMDTKWLKFKDTTFDVVPKPTDLDKRSFYLKWISLIKDVEEKGVLKYEQFSRSIEIVFPDCSIAENANYTFKILLPIIKIAVKAYEKRVSNVDIENSTIDKYIAVLHTKETFTELTSDSIVQNNATLIIRGTTKFMTKNFQTLVRKVKKAKKFQEFYITH